MITTFLGGSWAFWGGKLESLKYPRQNPGLELNCKMGLFWGMNSMFILLLAHKKSTSVPIESHSSTVSIGTIINATEA